MQTYEYMIAVPERMVYADVLHGTLNRTAGAVTARFLARFPDGTPPPKYTTIPCAALLNVRPEPFEFRYAPLKEDMAEVFKLLSTPGKLIVDSYGAKCPNPEIAALEEDMKRLIEELERPMPRRSTTQALNMLTGNGCRREV